MASCWHGVAKLFGPEKDYAKGKAAIKDRRSARGPGGSTRVVSDAQAVPGFRRSVSQLDRLLEHLPEDVGCGTCGMRLRVFWSTFFGLGLRPLLAVPRPWSFSEVATLREVQRRCLLATLPFKLTMELLQERWPTAEKGAASRAQLDALASVERMLGPGSSATTVSPRDPLHMAPPSTNEKDVESRRERYLAQARAFLVVAALLTQRIEEVVSDAQMDSEQEVTAACVGCVTTLLAAQRLVPDEWRHR